MTYIGIDVSKDSFVVAYSPEKACKTKTFKNTVKGIHKFIQTLSKDENHCVLEATGNYSALLVYLLSEAGIVTSVENPLKVKNFAKAMLSVIKTDEIDARLIALYGERMQPKPYTMPSKELLTLKQKRTVIRQLKSSLLLIRTLEDHWRSCLSLTQIARVPLIRLSSSLKSNSRSLRGIYSTLLQKSIRDRWNSSLL